LSFSSSIVNMLAALILSLLALQACSIVLDVNNSTSIREAAALAAHGLQSLYNGNQTGGTLGKWPYPPYYWWESGGGWGGMMGYWHYTGDASYNNVTYDALTSQLGPAYDFNMPSEAFDEGNDDQGFWVIAAMDAVEYGFPDPLPPAPAWLQVCINAFNDYVSRWDTTKCNGGLKWQFHPENAGYDYKNAISNGVFFQLSARLARYTGNQTYVDWANKAYDWSSAIGLVDARNYNVYDGTDDMINCTGVDHDQWSYNVGVFLYGAAVMQNYTNGTQLWVDRVTGFLDATTTFISPYPNSTYILFEAMCEQRSACNVDQFSFKAYLARWLAATSLLAPFTAARVGVIIQTSAMGAAAACTAGPYGNTCGAKWYINASDGTSGLGQQLAAMEVMYALLVNETTPPAYLPNVVIRNEPANVTSVTPALPSSTSRPLVGPGPAADASEKSANMKAIGALVAALACAFALI
jgi:mannan endo-1,6-alpha-mannosidase